MNFYIPHLTELIEKSLNLPVYDYVNHTHGTEKTSERCNYYWYVWFAFKKNYSELMDIKYR